jgi:non-heme chloroperoxidase
VGNRSCSVTVGRLVSDAWQVELKVFADAGFRTIAHDRRGHGRSTKTYSGNDMETYAKDLAELIDSLDLREVVLVGHSTGGGEVVKYAARHGGAGWPRSSRRAPSRRSCSKSDSNPEGTPIEVFDGIREGVLKD